jgi:hypothetical protein
VIYCVLSAKFLVRELKGVLKFCLFLDVMLVDGLTAGAERNLWFLVFACLVAIESCLNAAFYRVLHVCLKI